jgi:uncharacterized LabA/DUF88 family protein
MLSILIDFDNVDTAIRQGSVVTMAKSIVASIPKSVLDQYQDLNVRLYGGWRSQGTLTTQAQRIVPDIRKNSPTVISVGIGDSSASMGLQVNLADSPIWQGPILTDMLVKDRDLRKFRSRQSPWSDCANHLVCGMSQLAALTYSTACQDSHCGATAADVLIRDEQKMVDTLLVSDIAYIALKDKAKDLVVVSSDIDMWPGVLLALNAGCYVTHVHTKSGWRTQRHLMQTLDVRTERLYQQTSI